MTHVTDAPLDDCWNRIGVRGNASCPELAEYVHCRNCPAYSLAALELLDVAPPADYYSRWSAHFARKLAEPEVGTKSVVIFRVDREYLALSTDVFAEIASARAIHSIPQRRGGAVLGVANVRGRLVVCVSLRRTLGIGESERERTGGRDGRERLLVLARSGDAIACPVDEVYGTHRFFRRELEKVPSTLSNATAPFAKLIVPWRDKSVAILDKPVLFASFDRGLASTAT